MLQVNIEPLSPDELKKIIETKFPVLTTIAKRMVDIFQGFLSESHDGSFHRRGSRLTSTRDLFKWCRRAAVDYDVRESGFKVLQDGIDIFCCSYSDLEERVQLAQNISSILGK